jgi:hypothetical protein
VTCVGAGLIGPILGAFFLEHFGVPAVLVTSVLRSIEVFAPR